MTEKDFEALFENKELHRNVDQKIKKNLRRQIYLKIMIVIVALALIITLIYRGTDMILTSTNYNPIDEKNIVLNQDEHGFHLLMNSMINLYFPGKLYSGVGYTNLGFGCYEITAKIQDAFDPLYIDGQYNYTLQIQRSHLEVLNQSNETLSIMLNEYYDENQSESYKEYFLDQWQFNREDIEELPDSAVLDVSLSFPYTYTLQEAIDFMNQYTSCQFVWLATNVEGQIAEGFSLYDGILYDLSDDIKLQYPNLYLEQDITVEALENHYLSLLQLLLDHPDFISLLSTYYGQDVSLENMNHRYQKAKQNIDAIGVRGYVSKTDFEKMLDQGDIYYSYIHDVKLSKLQK